MIDISILIQAKTALSTPDQELIFAKADVAINLQLAERKGHQGLRQNSILTSRFPCMQRDMGFFVFGVNQ